MSAAIDLGRLRAVPQDRVAQMLILLPMLAYTLLSKIAIPLGSQQAPSFIPIALATMPLGVLTGRLEVQSGNLIFYMFWMAFLLLEQVFGGNDFSVPSLGLLFTVHLSYVFRIKPGLLAPDFHLRTFQNIAVFLAICGIAQFVLQFVIGVDWAFLVDRKLPEAIVLQNFHNMNPLGFRSDTFKSNGVFLIEPSFFSQISAVALLIELTYFRRAERMLLLLGAMVVSYSGTGFLLLFVGLPVLVLKERRYELLLIGAVVGAFAVALSSVLGLDLFVERTAEFSSPDSSAFARFVGGFYLFGQYLWPDTLKSLFGFGAGSVMTYIDVADFPAWDPSWVKMPFEYGLAGAGVYYAFVFFCTLRAPGSPTIKAVLLFALFVAAALIPPIHTMIISLLVWPWSPGCAPEPWSFSVFGRRRATLALA